MLTQDSVSKKNAYNFVRRRAVSHALRTLRRRHSAEFQALLHREIAEHLEEQQKGGR